MIEYEDITIEDYNNICNRIDKICACLQVLKCYTEAKCENNDEILNIDYLLGFAINEAEKLNSCL